MKTLDQVEARTPIPGGTTTVTVTQDGSYYLTGDIIVASGNVIRVTANNATLDLNGFSLSSSATTSSGFAVLCQGTGNYTVRNGHIRGSTTVNASTGVFTDIGLVAGVYVGNTAASARVENVDVTGISSDAIDALGATAVVSHCQVNVAAGAGIYLTAGTVDHCVATRCGTTAIRADIASDCVASSFRDSGIVATYSVTNSQGAASNFNGTTTPAISSKAVMNCQGIASAGGAGISGGEVRGSYGQSGSGTGIGAMTVADSYGLSSGGGAGIGASTAINSNGSSATGVGVQCITATNCQGTTFGTAATAMGIDCGANGVATGCYGNANSAASISIRAKIASGCSLGVGATSILHNVNSF